MINNGKKDFPLDRYPYMENDLKERTGDIQDIEKRLLILEDDNKLIDIWEPALLVNTDQIVESYRDLKLIKYGRLRWFAGYFKLNSDLSEGIPTHMCKLDMNNNSIKRYLRGIGCNDYCNVMFTLGGELSCTKNVNIDLTGKELYVHALWLCEG